MKAYKKLEVSEEYYKEIINTQFSNGSVVREHIMGNRTKLFSDDMFIATKCYSSSIDKGNLKDSQFFSFFGLFNKQLYNQFKVNTNLFLLDVEFDGVSRNKNYDTWEKLSDGDFFYVIDLKSAYWQIGYKLGYINDNMYHRYMNLDAYKQVKRYAFSFLARNNIMNYYHKGESYSIECDKEFLNKIYSNVRYALYNYINDCVKGLDNYIEYNIDGVVVTNKEVDKVMSYFNENDLKYKLVECRKMNEYEYTYNNFLRNFKPKPKFSML
jgi:hypothetical protein